MRTSLNTVMGKVDMGNSVERSSISWNVWEVVVLSTSSA